MTPPFLGMKFITPPFSKRTACYLSATITTLNISRDLSYIVTPKMSEQIETYSTGSAWYKCIPRMALGEAPIYRASDSTLHWVDCHSVPPTLSILSIDPISGAVIGSARVLPLADSVSVLFFRRDYPGSYICAYYQGIAHLSEKTGELTVLKGIISREERSERRFNDGGIDALGRFWLAEIDMKAMAYGANGLPESYGRPKGRLWRFDPDGELNLMMGDGLVCGNGVAWSPDNNTSRFSLLNLILTLLYHYSDY